MWGRILFVFCTLLLVIFCGVPHVKAYTKTIELTHDVLTFQSDFFAAGNSYSQIYGFDAGDPIRMNYSIPSPFGISVYAYAMVPIGYSTRPNVNSSGYYKYVGITSSEFSYLDWSAKSVSINVRRYHLPPQSMGYASYGYTISGSKILGSRIIEFIGPSIWALADFWYPNNEHITEYAEAGLTLSFSSITVVLHRTELSIEALPSEGTAPLTVSFFADAKDGVEPYSYFWDFGDGVSTDKGPVHTFYEPGVYNVSCRVADSLGVSDMKTLVIKVNPVVLSIEVDGRGSTSPPPGQYLKKLGEQVQVTALPDEGYALDCWILDGVPSGSYKTFNVVMNTNHTLKAKFTSGLQVVAYANPTQGASPLNVSFTSSVSGGSPPYSYNWDFGDFGISDIQNPYHVYFQPGSYIATVTVSDSVGRRGVAEVGPIYVLSNFDFTITKERDISLRPGESSSTRIHVNSSTTIMVSLSLEWVGSVPIGSTVQISPSSSLTNFTSFLSIYTSFSTPPGDYRCLVKGVVGNLTRSVEVLIKISPAIYVLDIQSGNGGTTSPQPGIYRFASGQSVQVGAIPDNDHQFKGWELDGRPYGSANPLSLMIYNNHTLKANFATAPKPPQSSITIDARYWDGGCWKTGDTSPYGFISISGFGWALTNPATYSVNISDVVGLQFIPRNREGLIINTWGGSPIAKVFSSYYTSGTTKVELNPSGVTYPNSYDLLVTSLSPYLVTINLKWVDYPVRVRTETPDWGQITVTSSSPSFSLYHQDPHRWGTYFVDHGYDIKIRAEPHSGYYFDKMIVDGKICYSKEVTLLGVKEPHEVAVHFAAVPQTFRLKIAAMAGGTTIPSPGEYSLPRYSSYTIKALITEPHYYFSGWVLDGSPFGKSERCSVFMDSDHELLAIFDTDYVNPETINVAPCDVASGTAFKKVILGEFLGVNVTGKLTGVTNPTEVSVTAWLDVQGASCWDASADKIVDNSVLRLEGKTITDSSGRFSIKLGSLQDKCWVAKALPGIYFAYAEIRTAGSQWSCTGTWQSENITTVVEFDYDITGAEAIFSMLFSSGLPVKNRAGQYAFGFREWDLGISESIDNNGTAIMRIPYKKLANTPFLQDLWNLVLYANTSGQISTVTWYRGPTVKFTEVSTQFLMHNDTCLLLEPFELGSPNRPDLLGATAYLWLNSATEWNGRNGILPNSSCGPSIAAPLERTGDLLFAVDPSGMRWRIQEDVKIPQGCTHIDSALFIRHPPLGDFLKSHKGEIYITIVPPHSTNVLYSPAKEGILLLVASLNIPER